MAYLSSRRAESGPADSWPVLIAQAAIWGLCSGVTLFVLTQHPPQCLTASPSATTRSQALTKTINKRLPADWISMACAFLQPRLFMGIILWQTFWHPQDVETESSTLNSHSKKNTVTTWSKPAPTDSQTPRVTVSNKKDPLDKPKRKRYIELLVHNVSHTDLILGLEPVSTPFGKRTGSTSATTEPVNESSFILCRPRFSRFRKYSLKLYQNLAPSSLLFLPCYQRRYDSPRYSIVLRKSDRGDPEYHQHAPTPTGLLLDRPVPMESTEVRVRGRDQEKMQPAMQIRQIFFPLLASLLPRWKQQITLKHGPAATTNPNAGGGSDAVGGKKVHRVLVLVSGVGTPRDTTQDPQDNSTHECAQIMKHFIQVVDPGITVLHIHSDWNIFRYDENVRFVKEVFMPHINAYRDSHATGTPYPHEQQPPEDVQHEVLDQAPFREDWRNSFTVTLSWADGSNARTYAIQSGLRDYRPFYFHFWQLKTFWHNCKVVIDDIEVHSYAAMELIPPVDTNLLSSGQDDSADIARVVEEIKIFRREMQETFLQKNHELSRFWLRKTRKPVLAVLLVRSGNSDAAVYRGTNMEVSMPTGSLCAERNVIGTALADNPALRRQDLKVLAVLAVPFDEPGVTQQSNMARTTSNASLADHASRKSSIGSEADNADWHVTSSQPLHHDVAAADMTMESSFMMVPNALAATQDDDEEPPARRVDLFSSATTQNTMRTVLLTRCKDLNPLSPCGACQEWLKKIAESNPYFKILTFTDEQCHGVYITPCKDS